jgi:hypothetical protein
VVVPLTVADREQILWVRDEPPTDRLAELRGVLLAEHEWRVRKGFVSRHDDQLPRLSLGGTPRASKRSRLRDRQYCADPHIGHTLSVHRTATRSTSILDGQTAAPG